MLKELYLIGILNGAKACLLKKDLNRQIELKILETILITQSIKIMKTLIFTATIILATALSTVAQTKTTATNKTVKTNASKQVAKVMQVGTKTDTEYHAVWYPSEIIKIEGDSFFIHYDNYDNSWDEWVKKDRLRFRQVEKTTKNNSPTTTVKTTQPSTNDIVFSNVCDYSTTFYITYNGDTETINVPRKSTYNKRVYNGSRVEQKANGYGTIDKGIIESYQSVIISSCQ